MRKIIGASKIIVLKDVSAAEQGAPKEVYNQNGVFRHMVDLQMKAQQWKL